MGNIASRVLNKSPAVLSEYSPGIIVWYFYDQNFQSIGKIVT